MAIVVLLAILLVVVIVLEFAFIPKPTKSQQEFFNRLNWQRETYGFEFYLIGRTGMGKHMKNATK